MHFAHEVPAYHVLNFVHFGIYCKCSKVENILFLISVAEGYRCKFFNAEKFSIYSSTAGKDVYYSLQQFSHHQATIEKMVCMHIATIFVEFYFGMFMRFISMLLTTKFFLGCT